MSAAGAPAPSVQVNLEQIDRAARALAEADNKNWGYVDVRVRYRGLALITVGAYLTQGSGEPLEVADGS